MKLLSFIIQNIFLQFSFGYCPDGSIKTESGDCEEAGVFLQCSSNGFKVEVPQSTLLTENSGRFHFRWLKIKRIDTDFPIFITLFFNHLK